MFPLMPNGILFVIINLHSQGHALSLTGRHAGFNAKCNPDRTRAAVTVLFRFIQEAINSLRIHKALYENRNPILLFVFFLLYLFIPNSPSFSL